MKVRKERLYDAFGELIYAIAAVDGKVQEVEIEALQKILKGHPWSREIKWSFDYENKKKQTVDEAYKKAIDICKEYGPNPDYIYLIEVMTEVAHAFQGIVPEEKELLERFERELKERFIKDLEKNKLRV
jgi:uncharacterized tellurite resistance protein B-like protein